MGDAFQDGPVMGDLARADPAVILVKGGIQDPVMGVDTPVPAHRVPQGPGLRGQAGDRAPDFRG